MNRKQARGLILPVLVYAALIVAFKYSGEWSRAEWHNHGWFRAAEFGTITWIVGLWARRRYSGNAI